MKLFQRSAVAGALVGGIAIAALLSAASPSRGNGIQPDSLGRLNLLAPEDVRVWSVYNPVRQAFVVWLTWRELPDSVTTWTHEADTTGWRVTTPQNLLSMPVARGPYTGDVDRTFVFTARDSGIVGQAQPVEISCTIKKTLPFQNPEDGLVAELDVGSGYVPGAWLPIVFDDPGTPQCECVDLGVEVAFGPGVIDRPGSFSVGLEDFEGYHIWRGIEPDGSDLTVIGELSKEEAFIGLRTGGNVVDTVYYYDIVPTLRDSMTWFSPFGTVDCLGTRIDINLADDQLFWFDCNAFNGFTYYYAVTTFDRGYLLASSRQGLQKRDHCGPTQGVPYECVDELKSLKMEVDAREDVSRIYAVPNPYRSGGSRLTTANYHNFPDPPDGWIRFVNVPVNSRVNVYTLAGDLVWNTVHEGPGGNVEWDTNNRNNQAVASGVYIYRVEDSKGQSMYGRIVIIR